MSWNFHSSNNLSGASGYPVSADWKSDSGLIAIEYSWNCLLFRAVHAFIFFFVRHDDQAKSSGWWLLGRPPSTVVRLGTVCCLELYMPPSSSFDVMTMLNPQTGGC